MTHTKEELQEQLAQFSTEELQAEIKRRFQEKANERSKVLRCRMCAYRGTIDTWGRPSKDEWDMGYCPFQKVNSGKRHRSMPRSHPACEYFKQRGL